MNVSFNGFNQNVLTFVSENDIGANIPVKLIDNGKVATCANGDEFIGVCVSSRSGYTGVQMTGYAKLTYSGDEIGVGYQTICADENGGVKLSETGRKVLVTDVDSTNQTVGFIM